VERKYLGTESKEFYALRRFSLQLVRSVLALFTMDVSRVLLDVQPEQLPMTMKDICPSI
jgi:hypothetical protein